MDYAWKAVMPTPGRLCVPKYNAITEIISENRINSYTVNQFSTSLWALFGAKKRFGNLTRFPMFGNCLVPKNDLGISSVSLCLEIVWAKKIGNLMRLVSLCLALFVVYGRSWESQPFLCV